MFGDIPGEGEPSDAIDASAEGRGLQSVSRDEVCQEAHKKQIKNKRRLPVNPTERRMRLRLDWAAKSKRSAGKSVDDIVCAHVSEQAGGEPLVHNKDVIHSCAWSTPCVAIVSCTRGCPAARLREWLFWHFSLGVSLFFLRWEGVLDKETQEVLRVPRERGHVILELHSRGTHTAGFKNVMVRQILYVNRIIPIARQHDCQFLLHLDDDELLFPCNVKQRIPDILSRYVGSSLRCVHFANLEAVFSFENATLRPFSRPNVRFRTSTQVLYCNGKSAANLTAPANFFAVECTIFASTTEVF